MESPAVLQGFSIIRNVTCGGNMNKKFISLREIEENIDECYAHLSSDQERKETIIEHTELCEKYFTKIVEKKQIKPVFEEFKRGYLGKISSEAEELFDRMTVNIIAFHDIGKINPAFQKKKMKNTWHNNMKIDGNIGSKHSIISAVFYLEYFLKERKALSNPEERKILRDFAYIYSFIISRHHGKMMEYEKYLKSFNPKDVENNALGSKAREWLKQWRKEVYGDEKKSIINAKPQIFLERLNHEESQKSVYLYAFTRLLYSLLVAADYYATSEFMSGVEIKDFGEIREPDEIIKEYEQGPILNSIRTYEKERYPLSEKELKEEHDINILRSEMFLEAEMELKKSIDQSIFYLEAPTGSGKSNTAMNLSFCFMKNKSSMKKIFYIYPFNTLVEQNLESMEKIFGKNQEIMSQIAVVNSLVPIKENKEDSEETDALYAKEQDKYQKMLLDRQFLNYPMVLSTHVMFFRTLFGDSKENVFGFHQLRNSVIVMDEIQSYKNSIWSELITFLKGMAQLLGMKIIIMSATLPKLDLLTDNKSESVTLIKNKEKYFENPIFSRRVIANYDLLNSKMSVEKLAGHVCENAQADKKILIELITKKRAEELYQLLKEQTETEVLLMTGDSSILERKRMIQKIKEAKSVIVVATQVIEAGVDIDMDIGYKNISKLDSEEQFMGRINRSGKRDGIAYFFELDDAKEVYKNDVRKEKEFTLWNDEMKEVLNAKNFRAYYQKILMYLKRNKERCDDNNLKQFFEERTGHLNLPEVAKRMQLIDDERLMISVYLAREIEDEDGNTIDGRDLWREYKELLLDNGMSFAEKTVKLYNIRSKMNGFIYQLSKKADFMENDRIGEIYYIQDGEEYFDENGVLQREKFKDDVNLFI